jgi:hypothetical protein
VRRAVLVRLLVATTTTSTLAGCDRDVSLLPGGADGGADSGAAGDGGPISCTGLPPIAFPTASGAVCASTLSEHAHRFALCACGDLDVASGAPVSTDSFDSSSSGSGSGSGPTAALGVGGTLTVSDAITARGALYASTGLVATANFDVGPSLRVGGAVVLVSGTGHVAGDAYVAGAISGLLQVDGLLHQPSGLGMTPPLIPESQTVREPVSVPNPCDCSSGFVDLGAAIATAQAKNDNAVAGFAPDALATVDAATIVDVTCGTYLLTSINATQTLVIAGHNRALLVVAGDVVVRAGMTVILDAGAELDMVVGGRLIASGGNPIGSAAPARFRLWIAGTDSVVLDDAPALGAMLHAPNAVVTASSGLQVFGGLFARSIMLGGQLVLHYDEAVLSSGASCGEPSANPVP